MAHPIGCGCRNCYRYMVRNSRAEARAAEAAHDNVVGQRYFIQMDEGWLLNGWLKPKRFGRETHLGPGIGSVTRDPSRAQRYDAEWQALKEVERITKWCQTIHQPVPNMTIVRTSERGIEDD